MNSNHESIDKYMIVRFYDAVPFCGDVRSFCEENPQFNDEKEVRNMIINASYTKLNTLPSGIVSNQIYFYDKEQTITEIINLVGSDFRALYLTNLERHPISIPYHAFYDGEWKHFTYLISEDGKIVDKKELTKEEASSIRDELLNKEYIKNHILEGMNSNMLLNITCAGYDFTIRPLESSDKYVFVNSEACCENAVDSVLKF